jgi:[glutamine synthetase] adenylyltransferase / [glutamine synthetase]-adenylyl-L-tyrosine phosphorylase
MSEASTEPLESIVHRALARLHRALPTLGDDPSQIERLSRLALASDFAIDTLVSQPRLLATLDQPAEAPPPYDPAQEAQWPGLLRRWRAAESTRLVWRDVLGLDSVEDTLAGSSWIAEQALDAALKVAAAQVRVRHGELRDEAGKAQSLVVFGLGKLGGGELNFSSDIDLIYAFAEHGISDGDRPLDAENYFTRVGQRLAQLLGEVTAEGFSHRVDLRLRPFGASGRLALSFAAMEQYYQRDGRDWERYAWIKARAVAGDIEAGERLQSQLQPFVYRRYLDYTALDGLREMKAMIDAEVQRREMADNLKLGPGGIREIEFLVQALQLIRAGREPALRERGLLPSLAALGQAGHLPAATVDSLAAAYRFLRRAENRVQMLADQQVHGLPDAPLARERIARALGYSSYESFRAALDVHRAVVSQAFADLLQSRRRRVELSEIARYWQGLPENGDADALADAGFADAESHHARLRDFARSPAVRALSERARHRLDQVLPALIEASAQSGAPDAALPRGLALMQAIARRASYLALLDEQPAALARLVDVTARSSLLSERLAAHPLLLDELLDSRAAGSLPDVDSLVRQVAQQQATLDALDAESALVALNELKQSLSFRIALATLAQRQPPLESARQLAALADALLVSVEALARRELEPAHGRMPGVGFAVIAYGSVGGRELGFDSDLDLVFLHDAQGDQASDGPRPIDVPRYFARLAQKLVGLLDTVTSAGRLYEVDMRLRPDGAKGVLVSGMHSFIEYQQHRAWTWESQALVRARAVAGDADLCARFETVRRQLLTRERDPAALRSEVIAMRRRMRGELDRSEGSRFDLKQGEGGLVDLEFLVQERVLALASAHPSLCDDRDTPSLLRALAAAGALPGGDASVQAHATLLARGLDCTLDRRPRIVIEDAAIADAREQVRRACRAAGLDFTAA